MDPTNSFRVHIPQAMPYAPNANQLVLDSHPSELPVHEHGLLERHVGVLVPVDQERWRVGLRDIANRTESIEGPGLPIRVVTGDLPGPETVLRQYR